MHDLHPQSSTSTLDCPLVQAYHEVYLLLCHDKNPPNQIAGTYLPRYLGNQGQNTISFLSIDQGTQIYGTLVANDLYKGEQGEKTITQLPTIYLSSLTQLPIVVHQSILGSIMSPQHQAPLMYLQKGDNLRQKVQYTLEVISSLMLPISPEHLQLLS